MPIIETIDTHYHLADAPRVVRIDKYFFLSEIKVESTICRTSFKLTRIT